MKIMGHRGARHEAPENTLLSIDTALRAGVGAIEIDVHMSADGHVVVIHDDTVDRTTDGSGPVSALTLAELRALDAGQGERIPTLQEVVEAVCDRAELFVELKGACCEEAVAKVVTDLGQLDACLAKAFDHRMTARIKSLAPSLRAGCLLYGRPLDPAGLVHAAGGEFISVSVSYVDAEFVELCHRGGLKVCAWNCNEPADVERFRAAGVDWLGTDVPTKLLSASR